MIRKPRFITGAAIAALLLPALAIGQMGDMIDNTALQTKVKAKLVADDPVEGATVNLETHNGVVQLGGFVDDEAKAKKAAELVAGVEGVRKVDNQLHMKPGERTTGQSVDDAGITSKIKAGLASANLGTAAEINIDTYNGVVLLTGFVDADETADLAEKYASEQDGVEKVINGIYTRD
jgi:hyperosmotically inducible protein